MPLRLPASATLGELKRQALVATRVTRDPAGYLVKYRGAELADGVSLAEAGVVPNGGLIVLSCKRRPVLGTMAVSPSAGRVLVLGAAALLVLDGVALLGLGIWGRRPGLALAGGALLAGAGAVVMAAPAQPAGGDRRGTPRPRADTEALRRLTRR